MAVCTACGADLVSKNGQLWDADGEPHGPNCPMRRRATPGRLVEKHHCEYCRKETEQEVTTKRGRENRRCLKCFRGGEVRERSRS